MKLDPIKDLEPVCVNCHAMIHKYKPKLSIDELLEIISSSRTSDSHSLRQKYSILLSNNGLLLCTRNLYSFYKRSNSFERMIHE